ncbi:DNA-binding transcriptional regulator GbsR (MarR family) [Saccharothrix tamanrassetensis]|uniref:DNA-binding transcriptional regulator GbsR (MarR family) n=1 Tax=Saccharothrix tamanrassetensis TaxID=1051531 RepID=A0A841CD99_9PSEU|nr:MarR family transcriptional regulator [Saccharothrix tamanrassetensis]MBB5954147.1 DNA-binding transcriptional regulator GbsR (MarR family) [Saccharothrix tamanrassetensis]
MTQVVERDEQAVLRFIERFASALAEAGMPRMPSRVFVALLASDDGSLTAAELADLLRVSPAAVSGAVRYLTQVSLVSRERETGSRRDVYRVYEDLWYEAIFRRDQMLARWEGSLKEGVSVLGPRTPAGRRISETLAFFEFFHRELPDMLERWRAYRDERFNS